MLGVLTLLGYIAFVLGANEVNVSEDYDIDVYSYDYIFKLMTDVTPETKFDETLAKEAYECIRESVKNSAFYDDYKSIHDERLDIKQMDQITYLDNKIGYNSGSFEKNYSTAFEFTDVITKTFKDFKDAHQKCEFSNTAQSEYYYTLAFVPQPVLTDTKTSFVFHKVLDGKYSGENSALFDLYNKYINSTESATVQDSFEWGCTGGKNIEELEGKEIIKIAGILPDVKDKNTNIEGSTPLEFFKEYSKETSNYSKDTGARMLDSIYNLKMDAVKSSGLPKYKGLRYTVLSNINTNELTTCDVPYVFINRIPDFGDEEGEDSHVTSKFNLKEVLVDLLFYDDYEGWKWYHLSIWTCYDDKWEERKYALLALSDMKPDDNTIGLMKSGFEANKDIYRLIIDIRGNNGGNPIFSSYLASWFNWDISEPHSRFLRMRTTKYNQDKFGSIGWSTNVTYDVYDHRKTWTKEDLFSKSNVENLEFIDTSDGKNTTYKSEYTKFFTAESEDVYVGSTYNYAFDERSNGNYYGEILDLDPVDVVLVTDGRCGSACATLYWNIAKNRSARIYNVGRLFDETHDFKPSAASFAGGQKIDISCGSGLYHSEIGYIPVKEYMDETSNTPLEFMYGDSSIYDSLYSTIYGSMSLNGEYPKMYKCSDTCQCSCEPICIGNSTECNGKYICEPNCSCKICNNVSFGLLDLIEEKVFKNHDAPGIVYAKKAEKITNRTYSDNYVLGNSWNQTSNDYDGNLVPLYCKAGYYEERNGDKGICKPVPNYEDDAKTMSDEIVVANSRISNLEESNDVLLALLIVFCILFAATLVILLLILFGVIPTPGSRKMRGKSLVEEVRAAGV